MIPSGASIAYGSYLKPGFCHHEGCTVKWDAGPRMQKYCLEHQKDVHRSYRRKHRRKHRTQILATEKQRRIDKKESINAGQRRRYAARKGSEHMHSHDGEQVGSVIVS